jgi:hypothetical protein
VVVIDSTQKTMALCVISRPTSIVTKLITIAKIRKYKGLHEGHHFIPMAMEMHDTFEHDMDNFIKECVCLFHDRQSIGHLSLFFAFNFLSNMLVLLFNMP